jgi:hypothetical protein
MSHSSEAQLFISKGRIDKPPFICLPISLVSVKYYRIFIYFTLLGFCVTIRWAFGIDHWIYWHLIHSTRIYRQYNAIADLHTLQFTVTIALGFSVFTSRILATDLYHSHCNFKPHMKSSFYSVIPSCHYSVTASSIPLLPSSHHDILASQNSTLFYTAPAILWNSRLWPLCTGHSENSMSIVEKACLQRRCIAAGVNSIVACVFDAAGCLPNRCLTVRATR